MIAKTPSCTWGRPGRAPRPHDGQPLRKRWLAELSQLYDIVNIDVWNKALIGKHLDTGGRTTLERVA